MSRSPSSFARQRGSAIMVALFVIVIMGLLATALYRLLGDSAENSAVEVRGARAFMAAESGIDLALLELFPLNSSAAVTTCPIPPLAPQEKRYALPDVDGFKSCAEVNVQCAGIEGNANGVRLLSTAQCGESDINSDSPDFAVERSVTAEVYTGVTP